ncbi:hypothetical protein CKA32_001166 [Geitlerinema sp. FC II]|nr:hypothetical protein CKA32_001166 [Geitlerinema sp. FC II]
MRCTCQKPLDRRTFFNVFYSRKSNFNLQVYCLYFLDFLNFD